MRNLLPITQKQRDVLLLIYKFRFLTTNHIQTILNHKNPHRIQAWLKDLTDKKYIQRHYSRKTFSDGSKPAIYYLVALSRHILRDQKGVTEEDLNKVYKESKRSQKFIDHCLSVADMYLFFIAQKQDNEELHFFTKNTLSSFDHFPNPLPDAYISVKTDEKAKRYFIDIFDEYIPSFVMRRRIKAYFAYAEESLWQAKTNSPLPVILLVAPSETAKKHLYWYSLSLLKKSFNDQIVFFLTTKDKLIKHDNKNSVWQKVEQL